MKNTFKSLTILTILFSGASIFAESTSIEINESVTLTATQDCADAHIAELKVVSKNYERDNIEIKKTCKPLICSVSKVANKVDKIPTYGPILGLFTKHKYTINLTTGIDVKTDHNVDIYPTSIKVHDVNNIEYKTKSDAIEAAELLKANNACVEVKY